MSAFTSGIWDDPFRGGADPQGSDPNKPNWTAWASLIDPQNERANWTQWTQPSYIWGNAPRGGYEYDPLPRGETYGPVGQAFGWSQIDTDIENWTRKYAPQYYADETGAFPVSPTNPGALGNYNADWSDVDNWNPQILSGVQKVYQDTGVYVPPNVVKAIMQIESNGVMLPPNKDSAVGLMQLTPGAYGTYDYQRLSTDPAYNIWAGTNDLALRYKEAQQQLGDQATWGNAATGYFSGHYVPTGTNDGHWDDFTYKSEFEKLVAQLDTGATTQTQTGGSLPAGTTQAKAVWGGFDAPISQAHGWSDFSRQHPDWYAYSSAYTRDRQPMGHPGVDVSVAAGTPLRTPVAGVVKIAGGTDYYKFYGQTGPGVGELLIETADGDQVILGHMRNINVQVGQQLSPGDFVGYSGGDGTGDHLHLEYRNWVGEGVTQSGWEVVDPLKWLSGDFTGSLGAAPAGGPVWATPATAGWSQFLQAAMMGQPIVQYASAGGWHDELRRLLKQVGDPAGAGAVGSLEESAAPSAWYLGATIPPPGLG